MRLHVVALAFTLFALAGCGEPGRARVSDRELVGDYVIEFQDVTFVATGQQTVAVKAKEHLTLNSDKTYTQTFSSATRNFTNHGTWSTSNEFLSGTQLEVSGANLSEDDPSDSQRRRGSLYLQVHRENGKLKLARNEPADWYYSPTQ